MHSLELNEVLYVGDIGYYVVQDFFYGTRRCMDWCVNGIKKRHCLLSVALMCKLIESDRRMLIQDLLLNMNFCGCSCRTIVIRYRCSKVSRNIPTEWEWTVSSSKSFISEGRKWFVNDTAKYHVLLVYLFNPGNIVSSKRNRHVCVCVHYHQFASLHCQQTVLFSFSRGA